MSRLRRLALVCLLLALVAIPAAWAAAKVLDAPTWIAAVLAGGAAAIPAAISAVSVSTALRRRRMAGAALLAETVETIGKTPGVLPLVRDADPAALGVTPVAPDASMAVLEREYVPRDADEEIAEAVTERTPLLLVGPSKAGKSRALLEAVLRTVPDHRLIVPSSPASLLSLLKSDPPVDLSSTVLWLDDIDRLLGPDGLSRGQLETYHRRSSGTGVVVASLREATLQRLNSTSDINHAACVALRWFTTVPLGSRLSETEIEGLRARAGVKSYLPALDKQGLGEVIIGGSELLGRLRRNERNNGLGAAVVKAAVHWRRLGFYRPVPRAVLEECVNADAGGVDEDEMLKAFAWASEAQESGVALLEEVDEGFVALDYLVDWIETRAPRLSEAVWTSFTHACRNREEQGRMAATAYSHGETSRAMGLWAELSVVQDEVGQAALLNVGMAKLVAAEPAEARDCWRRLQSEGDEYWSGRASLALGEEALGRRESGEAVEALEAALGSNSASTVARAGFLLGRERRRTGRVLASIASLSAGVGANDDYWSTGCRFELAREAHERGDFRHARTHYAAVRAAEVAPWQPWAVLNLALLNWREGNLDQAAATLLGLYKTNHDPLISQATMTALSLLEDERGEASEAARYKRLAATSNGGDWLRRATELAVKTRAPLAPFGFEVIQPEIEKDRPHDRQARHLEKRGADGPRPKMTVTVTVEVFTQRLARALIEELVFFCTVKSSGSRTGTVRRGNRDGQTLERAQTVGEGLETLLPVFEAAKRRQFESAREALDNVRDELLRAGGDTTYLEAVAELVQLAERESTPQLSTPQRPVPKAGDFEKALRQSILGIRLYGEGDRERAALAFSDVIASEVTPCVVFALHQLGHIQEVKGDRRGARRLWRRGMTLGGEASETMAVHMLEWAGGARWRVRARRRAAGVILERNGRSAPWAMNRMGLTVEQLRPRSALQWFRRAAQAKDNQDEAAFGTIAQAALELRLFGAPETRAWYEEYVASGIVETMVRTRTADKSIGIGPLALHLIPLLIHDGQADEALRWINMSLADLDAAVTRSFGSDAKTLAVAWRMSRRIGRYRERASQAMAPEVAGGVGFTRRTGRD